eukprot:jgi/Mesen1/8482/ME000048S07950
MNNFVTGHAAAPVNSQFFKTGSGFFFGSHVTASLSVPLCCPVSLQANKNEAIKDNFPRGKCAVLSMFALCHALLTRQAGRQCRRQAGRLPKVARSTLSPGRSPCLVVASDSFSTRNRSLDACQARPVRGSRSRLAPHLGAPLPAKRVHTGARFAFGAAVKVAKAHPSIARDARRTHARASIELASGSDEHRQSACEHVGDNLAEGLESSSVVDIEQLHPTVICFDLETTGLHGGCRILEIALRDLGGGDSSRMETLVNPELNIPYGATQIHNIDDKMVADKASWKKVALVVVAWVESRRRPGTPLLLAAHNARRFDVRVLRDEFERCGVALPSHWQFLDTLRDLAKKVFPGKQPAGKLKLEGLYVHYQLKPMEQTHRAMDDVNMLAAVLPYLCHDAGLRPHELEQLHFKAHNSASPRPHEALQPPGHAAAAPVLSRFQPASEDAVLDDDKEEEEEEGEEEEGEDEVGELGLDDRSRAPVGRRVLRRYEELKREWSHCLLLLQRDKGLVEAYNDDARQLARELGTALQGPREGVAVARLAPSMLDSCIVTLLARGRGLAVMPEEEEGRGMSAVFSAGALLDKRFTLPLGPHAPRLAALLPPAGEADTWGLACVDVSTALAHALLAMAPPPGLVLFASQRRIGGRLVDVPMEPSGGSSMPLKAPPGPTYVAKALDYFRSRPLGVGRWIHSSDVAAAGQRHSVSISIHPAAASGALGELEDMAVGGLVSYLGSSFTITRKCQGQEGAHTPQHHLWRSDDQEAPLAMDATTRTLLQVGGDGWPWGGLLSDYTRSPMGARLLRRTLLRPLQDLPAILARLDSVEVLLREHAVRESLQSRLERVGDVERVVQRLQCCAADHLDVQDLAAFIEAARGVGQVVAREGRGLPSLDIDALATAIKLVPLLRRVGNMRPPPPGTCYHCGAPALASASATASICLFSCRDEDGQLESRHVAALLELVDALAHLDMLCALAEMAAEAGYVRPCLTASGSVRLVHHDGEDGRTLQRVGLTQLLAQAGSFIPTQPHAAAPLQVVDNIITCRGPQGPSAVAGATSTSLVLVEGVEDALALSSFLEAIKQCGATAVVSVERRVITPLTSAGGVVVEAGGEGEEEKEEVMDETKNGRFVVTAMTLS